MALHEFASYPASFRIGARCGNRCLAEVRAQQSGSRVALAIGNADYPDAEGPLKEDNWATRALLPTNSSGWGSKSMLERTSPRRGCELRSNDFTARSNPTRPR